MQHHYTFALTWLPPVVILHIHVMLEEDIVYG